MKRFLVSIACGGGAEGEADYFTRMFAAQALQAVDCRALTTTGKELAGGRFTNQDPHDKNLSELRLLPTTS
ncbi:hypothetical protein BK659_07500 [Pseudomonas brassicacearum]|uniref:Uncharacterized protein n=1 Tax=Pseudomonas brassicacearum TaxID=930166 RepID=A0A423H9A2_9PSED|nr:hypothetical protein BK659_07500 [Pseudomonas brassicacearum]